MRILFTTQLTKYTKTNETEMATKRTGFPKTSVFFVPFVVINLMPLSRNRLVKLSPAQHEHEFLTTEF